MSISNYFLIFLILILNWLLFFFEEHSCTSECIVISLRMSRYLLISYIFRMLSSLLNNSSKKNFAEDIIKINWWHLPPIFSGEKQLILFHIHITHRQLLLFPNSCKQKMILSSLMTGILSSNSEDNNLTNFGQVNFFSKITRTYFWLITGPKSNLDD